MILYIDTTKNHEISVELREGSEVMINLNQEAKYTQAENLLPLIDNILKKRHKKKSDIKEIIVNNKGGTFTALRIGVITANALAFALGAKARGVDGEEINMGEYKIVKPIYSGEPNITAKKK